MQSIEKIIKARARSREASIITDYMDKWMDNIQQTLNTEETKVALPQVIKQIEKPLTKRGVTMKIKKRDERYFDTILNPNTNVEDLKKISKTDACSINSIFTMAWSFVSEKNLILLKQFQSSMLKYAKEEELKEVKILKQYKLLTNLLEKSPYKHEELYQLDIQPINIKKTLEYGKQLKLINDMQHKELLTYHGIYKSYCALNKRQLNCYELVMDETFKNKIEEFRKPNKSLETVLKNACLHAMKKQASSKLSARLTELYNENPSLIDEPFLRVLSDIKDLITSENKELVISHKMLVDLDKYGDLLLIKQSDIEIQKNKYAQQKIAIKQKKSKQEEVRKQLVPIRKIPHIIHSMKGYIKSGQELEQYLAKHNVTMSKWINDRYILSQYNNLVENPKTYEHILKDTNYSDPMKELYNELFNASVHVKTIEEECQEKREIEELVQLNRLIHVINKMNQLDTTNQNHLLDVYIEFPNFEYQIFKRHLRVQKWKKNLPKLQISLENVERYFTETQNEKTLKSLTFQINDDVISKEVEDLGYQFLTRNNIPTSLYFYKETIKRIHNKTLEPKFNIGKNKQNQKKKVVDKHGYK